MGEAKEKQKKKSSLPGFLVKLKDEYEAFSKRRYQYKRFKMVQKELKKRSSGVKTKKKKPKRQNITIIKDYLKKAGFEEMDERVFSKNIIKVAVGVCIFLSVAIIVAVILMGGSFLSGVFAFLAIWTIMFAFVMGLIWLFVYVYLDLKIYSRTKQLEDVLPDFLQLTSANISAGMPIDQALWYAVRPKFGVLANEIEEVAKSTIAGDDLDVALKEFTKKYDSMILKRSVNLIIEGMRAGGELADLLSKISIDIQETKLMRKEIAASVMTYVIFITFATIAAAPFLFALSTQLVNIIQTIMGSLDLSNASTGAFSISVTGDSIKLNDFKIFSILTLAVSSAFSAAIVSTIRKGNIRDGLKFIPAFMLVSLILYFIANAIVGAMMSSFI